MRNLIHASVIPNAMRNLIYASVIPNTMRNLICILAILGEVNMEVVKGGVRVDVGGNVVLYA